MIIKRAQEITKDNFERGLNHHSARILGHIISNPKDWDDTCKYSIKTQVSGIHDELSNIVKNDAVDKSSLEFLFSYLIVFVQERNLLTGDFISPELTDALEFTESNLERFVGIPKSKIEFSFKGLSITLFKEIFNNENTSGLINLNKTLESAKTLTKKWDDSLKERENNIARLEQSLKKFENAFNFVGLHEGFQSLHKKKKIERNCLIFMMLICAALALSPLVYKLKSLYFKEDEKVNYIYKHIHNFGLSTVTSNDTAQDTPPTLTHEIISLLPVASFIAIMLYLFRVLLFNYKSICAQILQVELRMTLCRFITSYSDYAKDIKNNSGVTLDRFESIIFSGIVNNDSDLPATYDGVEQLASLFKSMKTSS